MFSQQLPRLYKTRISRIYSDRIIDPIKALYSYTSLSPISEAVCVTDLCTESRFLFIRRHTHTLILALGFAHTNAIIFNVAKFPQFLVYIIDAQQYNIITTNRELMYYKEKYSDPRAR